MNEHIRKAPPNNLDKLKSEYDSLQTTAKETGKNVATELEKIIAGVGVTLSFPVEIRIKSWSSIGEKLLRLNLNIHSLKELDDLIGIRAVTLFRPDATAITEKIKKTFTIVKSKDNEEFLGADRFGYSCSHFVVSIPSTTTDLMLRVEVQIRTLGQHLWAQASHLLQYKHEDGIPVPLRRSIHRVSALLETADLELERIFNERKGYIEAFNILNDEEGLSILLLQLLLQELLPRDHFVTNDHYFALMTELLLLGIKSKGQVRQLILEEKKKALYTEQEMVEIVLEDLETPVSEMEELRKTRILFTQVQLVELMLMEKYGEKYRRYGRGIFKE